MNQQEQFGWNPNPNLPWNPNWNQNQTIRNLENRVTRLEREVQRLNNRVSRIEQIINAPTPFRETTTYQTDSYNMM